MLEELMDIRNRLDQLIATLKMSTITKKYTRSDEELVESLHGLNDLHHMDDAWKTTDQIWLVLNGRDFMIVS